MYTVKPKWWLKDLGSLEDANNSPSDQPSDVHNCYRRFPIRSLYIDPTLIDIL